MPAPDKVLSETSDTPTAIDKAPSEVSDTLTAADKMPSEASDTLTATDTQPSDASDTHSANDTDTSEASDTHTAPNRQGALYPKTTASYVAGTSYEGSISMKEIQTAIEHFRKEVFGGKKKSGAAGAGADA
ncbi:MAG: hypothetical protein K2M90_03315 [Treponemataceae bacterium]|nr:hypothetical protein [Treponemataceae bacterium]